MSAASADELFGVISPFDRCMCYISLVTGTSARARYPEHISRAGNANLAPIMQPSGKICRILSNRCLLPYIRRSYDGFRRSQKGRSHERGRRSTNSWITSCILVAWYSKGKISLDIAESGGNDTDHAGWIVNETVSCNRYETST